MDKTSHASPPIAPEGGTGQTETLSLRLAAMEDLDSLTALEARLFATDRISRRNFRHFLKRPTAVLIVADRNGELVGYALVLFRAGTALARLYSLAVAPQAQGHGLGGLLLEAAERAAYDHDRLFLRLEVREDNAPARRIYERANYKRIGRIADYYEDGEAALRLEKRLHGGHPVQTAVPFFPQTTEFTCGPACLRMAFGAFGRPEAQEARSELRLWREATTIYLASGLGGCEPYGLAIAARKRGLKVEIRVNHDDFFFLTSVRDEDKRDVMRVVQEDFRAEAARMAIPVIHQPLSARELGKLARSDTLSIVLISGYSMYRKKEPHWVLVHGADDRHVIVHDPWIEPEVASGRSSGADPDAIPESATDAAHLPIPFEAFERMARWGTGAIKAQILLSKDPD